MSLFGSLIPGLREIRAPLVSGYLWFVCGWLLLEPALPSVDSNEIYSRFASLGEAIGPLGLAATASVAAYLFGSLVQLVFRLGWKRATRGRGPMRLDEGQQVLFAELAEGKDEPRDVETILRIADPFQDASLGRSFADDTNLSLSIWELADRELIDAFRQLQWAVRSVQRGAGRESIVCYFGMHTRTPIVRVVAPRPGDATSESEFVVPHLLPSRDLLDQMDLLQTRLLEVAEATGAQVERLQTEAEFRIAIVPPLVFLIGILAVAVNPLWLFALLLPAALLVQGIDLSRRATAELFDALRARAQTPELEQITPIFSRYRAFASQLADGLQSAQARAQSDG